MDTTDTKRSKKRSIHRLWHISISILLLVGGCVGMSVLSGMRKAPEESPPLRTVLAVRTVRVEPTETTASITGYGTARVLRRIPLSAEVAGRVVFTHPRLRTGECVQSNDVLFVIDPVNYEAGLEQAAASAAAASNRLMQITETARVDTLRLGALERSAEIAENEFKRVEDLLRNHQIGAETALDRAEQAALATRDAVEQLRLAVMTHPSRIEEAGSAVRSALARLAQAAADRDRCTVRAPLDGRLAEVHVEIGQFVTPGSPTVTLADDSELEMWIPIPEQEAREWLPFAGAPADASAVTPGDAQAWYPPLSNATCRISWEAGSPSGIWHGTLHRIVEVNSSFRTITVAIRVSAHDARGDGSAPPLVDGMFCRAEIPGRTIRAAAVLPRWAVTIDNTVFLAVTTESEATGPAEPRKVLRTVKVAILREQGENVYLAHGLEPGDEAILTRLIDPLEGVELSIEGGRSQEP